MDDLTSLGTIQPAPQIPFMLRRVIGRYVRAFAPERILLFGSYAKGTSHEGSDIDLLVVANLIGDPSLHLSRARQLASDCFPTVDVVICSPQDVINAEPAKSLFLLAALENGITLYHSQ